MIRFVDPSLPIDEQIRVSYISDYKKEDGAGCVFLCEDKEAINSRIAISSALTIRVTRVV